MNFRLAVQPEVKYLSQLVADAFKDYDLYQQTIGQTFKQAADFHQFLKRLHDVHLAASIAKNKVFVLEDGQQILSVVVLDNERMPSANMWQYIQAGGWQLVPYFIGNQLGKFLTMLDKAEKLPQQKPQTNWHVNLLAVNPVHQGQKIGSRTLETFVIPYAKAHGAKTLSLITNTPRNVSFYQKNQFQVVDERMLYFNGSQVSNWSLVRTLT